MASTRREFLKAGSALWASTAVGTAGCATTPANAPKVVVVGGGYGGATAAKHVRKWSDGRIGVKLTPSVERSSE